VKKNNSCVDLDSLLREVLDDSPHLPTPKLSPQLEDLHERPPISKAEARKSIDSLGIDFSEFKQQQILKYEKQQEENAILVLKLKDEKMRKKEEEEKNKAENEKLNENEKEIIEEHKEIKESKKEVAPTTEIQRPVGYFSFFIFFQFLNILENFE
jgi:hypothetical protein